MSEHTPGPWGYAGTRVHLDGGESPDGWFEIAPFGGDGELDWDREIAATAGGDLATQEANVRFIVAAPRMEEALRAIENHALLNGIAAEPVRLVEVIAELGNMATAALKAVEEGR